MDTLYTFWDHITYYKTESVHFWGLMNSATKKVSTNHVPQALAALKPHPKTAPAAPRSKTQRKKVGRY